MVELLTMSRVLETTAGGNDMTSPWRTHQVDLAGDAIDHVGREWLLTNGAGGYAMGTLPGVNTRRYHGLLVAATHPPVGRIVALNQVFEQLDLGDEGAAPARVVEWATCCFKSDRGALTYASAGYALLGQFTRGPEVVWTYQDGPVIFRRELRLHWKRQAATLRYVIEGLDRPATLRLAPMLTLRDFHAVMRQADGPAFDVRPRGDVLTVARDRVVVTLHCPGAVFRAPVPRQQWWYGVHYPLEAERGQEDCEDYFVPGRFEIRLPVKARHEVLLTVTLGEQPVDADLAGGDRVARLDHILGHLDGGEPEHRLLVLAVDDFIVARHLGGKELATILAGYPWFSDWGRDTFISLPGLLLATGRFEEARDTLHVYALALKDGVIPNRFDDYGGAAAHYNTVDASLWFIHAAMAYRDAAGDDESWRDWLAPAVMKIIEAHIRGTTAAGTEIRMAGDGLITAGNSATQLTWMDAKCGDVVFTPRQGKAVEVNALWYHALEGMSQRLPPQQKSAADHYKKLAGRIRRSFAKAFWDEELGYLRDHVWIDDDGNERADRTLRPNQILAASLPHTPMPRTKLRIMLDRVRQQLLTPYGLRTLPENDRHYHPHYRGSPFERDEAYHQGTVWPWLIGPYAEAVLRVGQFSAEAKQEARQAIDPLLRMLAGEGPFPSLGQLHEIHEAAPPHRPVGCMAQAWSVAEVLRVLRLIETA